MAALNRIALLALLPMAVACGQAQPLPELRGGVEMGVERGAAWTTLTVKPPHIIGPRTNLQIKNGVISGQIDGRGVNLRTEPDGVSGMGPFGPVAVDLRETEDAVIIEGTWNGSRVHFEITNDSFRGTIPIYTGNNTGQIGADLSCQYVLDRVDTDGARVGSSICNALPEDTRLEVPGQIQAWLTRTELATVLLALLSSPPSTAYERRF